MSRNVVSVMPGHSVQHAARIMLEHHISGLPVIDGDGRLVGMFTEGDLLRRIEFGPVGERPVADAGFEEGAARNFVRSHGWQVSDVMSSPVVSARESTPLTEIARQFRSGIKRVPVMRDGEVVGIVSRSDLLRVIAARSPDKISAGDEALRTSVHARLSEAGALFARRPDITVADGVVHLWGTVRSEAERDAARVAVEGMDSLRGIENHLTVLTPAHI